jgi:hypothetical protein
MKVMAMVMKARLHSAYLIRRPALFPGARETGRMINFIIEL